MTQGRQRKCSGDQNNALVQLGRLMAYFHARKLVAGRLPGFTASRPVQSSRGYHDTRRDQQTSAGYAPRLPGCCCCCCGDLCFSVECPLYRLSKRLADGRYAIRRVCTFHSLAWSCMTAETDRLAVASKSWQGCLFAPFQPRPLCGESLRHGWRCLTLIRWVL